MFWWTVSVISSLFVHAYSRFNVCIVIDLSSKCAALSFSVPNKKQHASRVIEIAPLVIAPHAHAVQLLTFVAPPLSARILAPQARAAPAKDSSLLLL